MKRLLIALALASGFASMASAADMPLKVPPRNYMPQSRYIPAVESPDMWTGMYIGGNAGHSWGREHTSPDWYNTAVSPRGGFFGFQLGYNQLIGRSFLVGLETDIQNSWQKASKNQDWSWCVTQHDAASLDWFGTTRVRVGFLPTDSLLVYATGGVAYGQLTHDTMISNGVWTADYFGKQTRVGWTAGGGVEYKIDPNWSIKGEYLRIDLSGFTSHANPGIKTRFTDDIGRVGFNYRF